ncbi:hypothetical protein ABHF33_00800 [Chitinibacter sp. FCG-7]|uniref:Uncharacterized protein n=1 Tax=Chitinibacter mangrovi TaxID=3153927 RepID=A0AAU7FAX5_9NEIS
MTKTKRTMQALSYGIKQPSDLLAKLKWDADKLTESPKPYDVFNFVILPQCSPSGFSSFTTRMKGLNPLHLQVKTKREHLGYCQKLHHSGLATQLASLIHIVTSNTMSTMYSRYAATPQTLANTFTGTMEGIFRQLVQIQRLVIGISGISPQQRPISTLTTKEKTTAFNKSRASLCSSLRA